LVRAIFCFFLNIYTYYIGTHAFYYLSISYCIRLCCTHNSPQSSPPLYTLYNSVGTRYTLYYTGGLYTVEVIIMWRVRRGGDVACVRPVPFKSPVFRYSVPGKTTETRQFPVFRNYYKSKDSWKSIFNYVLFFTTRHHIIIFHCRKPCFPIFAPLCGAPGNDISSDERLQMTVST